MAKQRLVWPVLVALALYLLIERLPAERLERQLRAAQESLKIQQPERAEAQFRQVLASLGPRPRRRTVQARALEGLARALQAEHRLPQALSTAEQALAVREAAQGRDAPAVAECLCMLAEIHDGLGQYREALPPLDRALEIDRARFGRADARCAMILNQRSVVLVALGDLPRAEASQNEALLILTQREIAAKHRELQANVLVFLGWIKLLEGKLAEARPAIEQGWSVARRLYGPNSPRLAGFLYKRAVLENQAGNFWRAEQDARSAREILSLSYQPDQQVLALSTGMLGQALTNQDRDSEAEPLLREALGIHEKLVGPKHPETAVDLRNLAHLLERQHQLDEADALASRALAIEESTRGPSHFSTAVSLTILAEIRLAEDRADEARQLLHRAEAILRQSVGDADPFLARIWINVARIQEKAGELESAEKLYANALTLQEKGLPPNHPTLAKTLDRHATLLHQLGRDSEANALESKARRVREAEETNAAP